MKNDQSRDKSSTKSIKSEGSSIAHPSKDKRPGEGIHNHHIMKEKSSMESKGTFQVLAFSCQKICTIIFEDKCALIDELFFYFVFVNIFKFRL